MENKGSFDLAFVADGNPRIGMGHIMRCAAIGEAARERGLSVCYLCSDERGAEQARRLGFDAFCLGTDYRRLEEAAEPIRAWIRRLGLRFIFFDSYFASDELFLKVAESCPLGCFGYGRRYSEGMSLLVPYGVSRDEKWLEDCFKGKETGILSGSAYVPLRRPFWGLPERSVSPELRRILITSGGGDALGLTEWLLEALDPRQRKTELLVTAGPFFGKDRLEGLKERYPSVHFLENQSDLSPYMRESDLAISAGGITLYELMACSVPVIAYAFADNQLGNRLLAPAVCWAGDVRRDGRADPAAAQRIAAQVKRLEKDWHARSFMVKYGRKLCDGRGALRIAEAIQEKVL